MDEATFKEVWSRRTHSDHPPRPGIDVFAIGAGEVQTFLGRGASRRVLEIGCGAGELFAHLELDRTKYLGVDFSPSVLRVFNERHPGVRTLEGDAATFWIDEPFDFILVNNVVQYCKPWTTLACLRNLERMLAPGGEILLGNVPNRRQRLAFVRRRFSPDRQGPIVWLNRLIRGLLTVTLTESDPSVGFWYTPPEIARMARSVGLESSIFGCVLYPYRFSALLRRAGARTT